MARDCKVTAAYGLSKASLKGLFMCRDSRGGAEGGGKGAAADAMELHGQLSDAPDQDAGPFWQGPAQRAGFAPAHAAAALEPCHAPHSRAGVCSRRSVPKKVSAAHAALSPSLGQQQHTEPRRTSLPHVASAFPRIEAAAILQHASQDLRLRVSSGMCRRCGMHSSSAHWRSRRRGMSSHALASENGRAGVDRMRISNVPMPERAIAPDMRRREKTCISNPNGR